MRYPIELRKTIKLMEHILIDGICNADSKYRLMALKRLKNVSYRCISNKEGKKYGLGGGILALYNPTFKQINILKERKKSPIFKNLLIHEMCHAVSKSSDSVGFNKQTIYDLTDEGMKPIELKDIKDDCHLFIIESDNVIFNEAANEFFASSFYGEKPVTYTPYIPFFHAIAHVCGYKETLNCFFANDFEGLIKLAAEKFHLKDESPLRLLSYKMTASMLKDQVRIDEFGDCLNLMMSIYTNKLIKEKESIKGKIDWDKFANIREVFGLDKIEEDRDTPFNLFNEQITNAYNAGVNFGKEVDLSKLKEQYFNVVRCILTDNKNYNETDIDNLAENLPSVILLLKQKILYMQGAKQISSEVLGEKLFAKLANKNEKFNFDKYNDFEKDYIIKNLVGSTGFDFGESYKFIEIDDFKEFISRNPNFKFKYSVQKFIGLEPKISIPDKKTLNQMHKELQAIKNNLLRK